jgi:hypothetical protein
MAFRQRFAHAFVSRRFAKSAFLGFALSCRTFMDGEPVQSAPQVKHLFKTATEIALRLPSSTRLASLAYSVRLGQDSETKQRDSDLRSNTKNLFIHPLSLNPIIYSSSDCLKRDR